MASKSLRRRPRWWSRARRILAIASPNRRQLAAALFLVLLASGAALSLPLGMRALLDHALAGADHGLLRLLAIALLSLFVLRAVLSFSGQYMLRLAGEKIVACLRHEAYQHLHRLSLAYHGQQKVGDLTSRLINDTNSIRAVVTDVLVSTVLQVFQLLGAVAVMLWLNWRLTLIVLVFAPIGPLISKAFSPILERLARAVQDKLADCAAVAQEALSSMPVVQAFARSGYETQRYGRALDALIDTVRSSTRTSVLFGSCVHLLVALSTVAIFWWGGREVLAGRLSAGDLVAFMFYCQTISQAVGALAGHFAAVSTAAGASERVFELLDTQPEVREMASAKPLPALRGCIQFQRVSFSYTPRHPTLSDLSFRIEAGEKVALVGRSGAGKSTILHLILRLFDPTSGRVLIDGHDLRTLEIQSFREQVAWVSQEVYIFGATVRENIRYGRLDANDEEIELAARAANAHDFLDALPDGYDTVLGEGGVGLSGGQRQRLAIARALLKDARILILDEATSSVDLLAEAAIQEAVERVWGGRTTIQVTHRLSSLRHVDRILVVDDGRLVEAGREGQLLATNGLYRRLLEGRNGAGTRSSWMPAASLTTARFRTDASQRRSPTDV